MTPPKFIIKPIHQKHLSAVMTLQKIILESLPENQKNAIIPKAKDEFAKRMTDWGTMFAVFTPSKKMIAYTTLALPNVDWPVADMLFDKKDLPCSSEKLAVLQNSVVHPYYREKHVHALMIQARLDLCQTLGRTHVMTEIAAFNPSSLAGIMKSGLQVMATGIDPSDKCKLLFLHKKISAEKMVLDKPEQWFDPMEKFLEVKKLLAQGWRGTKIKRTGAQNAFQLALQKQLG